MSTHPPARPGDPDFNPFGPDSGFGPDAASRAENVDIIGLIRRGQKTVLFGLFCGLLLGTLVYILLGPTYEASTKLAVSLKASVSDENTGDRTFSDRASHLQRIKSDAIVKKAVEAADLDQLDSLRDATDPVEAIADKIDVKRSSGDDRAFTNIFDLSYESPSKDDAAAVVEAIVAAYQSYLEESRDASNEQVMGAVSGSAATLKAEIDALQEEHLTFRAETPLHWNAPVGQSSTAGGNAQAPTNYFMARLNAIEDDRLETDTEYASTQARIDALTQMQARGESPEALEFFVLTMISQPAAAGSGDGEGGGGAGASAGAAAKSALTSELIKAFVTRTRLVDDFGADSDQVKKADSRIDAIGKLYKAEGLMPPDIEAIKAGDSVERPNLVEVYVSSLKLKLVELEERSKELDKLYKAAREEAKEAAVAELKDKQIADELAVKQTLYEQRVKQAGNLDTVAGQKGFEAEQIDPTRVQLAIKRILKIVGAFGALAIVATLLGLYLSEATNTSLRDAGDVARFTGTSVLGNVPHFAKADEAALSLAAQTGLDPSLRYYYGPGSQEAEAFRSVRTALFHSDVKPDGRGAVIQVTSAEPGDGKSTVAANLAAAVAQSGRRVLLVDADLRRSTAHTLFGLRGERGLTDVLTGELGWQHAVESSGIDRLSILPAGSRTEMPAELLSNSALGELLETARGEYDFVILDTPPLLAVSDPAIVAPYSDGVLLVVRLEKNRRDHATDSVEIIRSHGMRLLGAVVNDSDAKSTAYYPEYHRQTPATPVRRPAAPPAPKPEEVHA